MSRLHKFGDPSELLVVHHIGRNVRGDRNVLQPRAHHREFRRPKDERLHGNWGKWEGHNERSQIFEVLQKATPLWAGETFRGCGKESAPHLFGNDDRKRRGRQVEGSESVHSIEVLIKRGEYRGGITSSSPRAPLGISFTCNNCTVAVPLHVDSHDVGVEHPAFHPKDLSKGGPRARRRGHLHRVPTSLKERAILISAEEGTSMRWRIFDIASEVREAAVNRVK